MPKRTDIQSVLVIGSGPIVIGQAAEFDYSGTQACRILKAEGLRVILVNSNPATIMTDPEIADATYVEPITPEFVEKIIAKERPDALLPTLGGQTALNTAISMHEQGVLEKYGVELIGANVEAINKGEDRDLFKGVVEAVKAKIGYGESARSVICHSMDDVIAGVETLGGYPVVVRPSFTMGGAGSGFAHDEDELRRIAGQGLTLSPTTEVLLEESILGWKEYELELMRDTKDNVVVVCSIENFDPMGVHTGDSITVAPAMTLTDREYQRLRDIGIAIIREVGVDTGGCNIQFAIDPVDGRVIVIEMNPRVSRSSALASKATGFPIAKIAAKLAIGYTLDEVPNDITEKTPASFEPTLDYVVVKAPRFAFEKFPAADATLTTTMKSVGEAMAIGRNFTEALQKALRSLEKKGSQFTFVGPVGDKDELLATAVRPTDGRINTVMQAIRAGATQEEVFESTKIDPWFVDQLFLIKEIADELAAAEKLHPELLAEAKRHGFSDAQIAEIRGLREDVVREVRHALGVRPVYKTVDTCAAEFAAKTPYFYSSYDEESEVAPRTKPAVIILGSGPNRIGQGIEFDYSCVHASFALSDAGYETVMVNCNPETVSTDYDTSDRLYFEPLTLEDVLEIVHAESLAGPSPVSSSSSAARPPSAWRRRSRTTASRSSAPRRRPSTPPRTAAPSARSWPRRACPPPSTAPPPPSRVRRRSRTRSATRSSCARPTCSVAAAWRSSTTRPAWSRTSRSPRRSPRPAPCWSTASSTTRSRSTWTPSTTATSSTSAASWSTSRKPASTPATPPAPCPRSPSAATTSSGCAPPPRPSPRASASAA
ncbi:Carbamoyl-phosphate synthase large chain [Streptomyces lavendulae subsp. lavendulae]